MDRPTTVSRSSKQWHPEIANYPLLIEPTPDVTISPNADGYNLSLAVVRDRLGDVLSPTASFNALRSLQHFQTKTGLALGFERIDGILSFLASQAIWEYPFLMHSILAVTNSHLKRLYCSDQDAVVKYKILEANHWQYALHLYRNEIQCISNQQRSNVDKTDALFATALLSVVFTFAADDEIRPDTITSGDEGSLLEAFNTFLSMTGFQALILFLPYMDISPSWEAVLRSADDEVSSFSSDAARLDDLPIAFVRLCGLTPTSSPTSNIYHKLLRALTPILLLEPGRQNIPKIFAYIGRVWPSARSLFITKDPIALLFLSWWLTELRQLDLWWATTRARSQSQAIVNYLRTLTRLDLLPFLEYPETFGAVSIDWIWHETIVNQ